MTPSTRRPPLSFARRRKSSRSARAAAPGRHRHAHPAPRPRRAARRGLPFSQQAPGTLTPPALLGVAGGAAGIASPMHGAGGAGKRGPRKKEGAGVTPTPTLTLTLTLMLTLTLTSCGVQSSEFIRAYARQTDQDSPLQATPGERRGPRRHRRCAAVLAWSSLRAAPHVRRGPRDATDRAFLEAVQSVAGVGG